MDKLRHKGQPDSNGDTPEPEDQEAKKALQGIWIDQETETVSFCAKGDTIYYPDTANVPVRFYP